MVIFLRGSKVKVRASTFPAIYRARLLYLSRDVECLQ